ncbi:MAG TPA: hypothetical protein PLW35_11495, partial [Verrucomicrobiota bacterium]|nr:hypothetical protein [Verrucomicrobiota bacterium]
TNVGFTLGDSDPTNKLIRVVEGDALFVTYHDVLPPVDTTAFSRVDGLPPVTTLVPSWPFRMENGTNIASSVCSYSLVATDASGVSQIEYSLDSGPVIEFINPFLLSSAGPHTVAFRSQDRADHWETWRVEKFIVEDDYDHDGMLDAWEILQFGDLTVADATSDRDGDRARDVEEFVAGTDPNNAQDYFHIQDWFFAETVGGNLVLRWNSVTGRVYTVNTATNLAESSWSNVLQRMGDGTAQSFTNPLPDVPHRFFRLRVEMLR